MPGDLGWGSHQVGAAGGQLRGDGSTVGRSSSWKSEQDQALELLTERLGRNDCCSLDLRLFFSNN